MSWQDYPCILLTPNHKGGYVLEHRIPFRGKLAHRVTFFKHFGHWPANNCCHHCDKRNCVQIQHLFDGTQLDNMQDANKKGRLVIPSGWNKLPDSVVKRIHNLLLSGVIPAEIARIVSVDKGTVGRYRRKLCV